MEYTKYKKKDGSLISVPVFEGKAVKNMPKLVSQGYTPISVAEAMEQKLKAWESEPLEVWSDSYIFKESWKYQYFDSGDGIIYHPDGRIKIVYDSETLKNINKNTNLIWQGAQLLPNGSFDKTQGEEFSRKDVHQFANKWLSQKNVLNNPIWLALARGDKELLKNYTEQVYSRSTSIDLMLMIIYVSNVPNWEAERLLSLGGEGSPVYANFDGGLDKHNGYLVGVPPKVHAESIPAPTPKKKFNIETLMREFNILKEEGYLNPKIEEVLEKYKI